jgi:hypothetical protein
MPLELFLRASRVCARPARTIAGFEFGPSLAFSYVSVPSDLEAKIISVKCIFSVACGAGDCMVVTRTSKQGATNMSEKNITITITLDQAYTAIDCIDRDMDYSTHSLPDYYDLSEMLHNLRRVELRERLHNAIKALKETK